MGICLQAVDGMQKFILLKIKIIRNNTNINNNISWHLLSTMYIHLHKSSHLVLSRPL